MYIWIIGAVLFLSPLFVIMLIDLFLPIVLFVKIESILTSISIVWIPLSCFLGWLFGLKYEKLSEDSQRTVLIISIVVFIILFILLIIAFFDINNLWLLLYITTLLDYLIISGWIVLNHKKPGKASSHSSASDDDTAEWIEIKSSAQYVGDLNLKKLNCESCGAPLDEDSISIKAGAVQVSCPYCGTSYLSQRA